jgi:hypothetical protein
MSATRTTRSKFRQRRDNREFGYPRSHAANMQQELTAAASRQLIR